MDMFEPAALPAAMHVNYRDTPHQLSHFLLEYVIDDSIPQDAPSFRLDSWDTSYVIQPASGKLIKSELGILEFQACLDGDPDRPVTVQHDCWSSTGYFI